jgi:hypothetical protein
MSALRVRLMRQIAQQRVGIVSARPVLTGPALVCQAHGLVADGCRIKRPWEG